MSQNVLVNEWLEKAKDEEQFARSILSHRDAPAWGVCFHSHQLAEKSLKAYLVAKQNTFPKIHQLDRLLALCAQFDNVFNELTEDAQSISSYYFEDRYPGPHPPTTWEEAEEALNAGRYINSFVCERLHNN